MLFASWEVRIAINYDRGLENAARGRRPTAVLSRPRSKFFAIERFSYDVTAAILVFQNKENCGHDGIPN